jgi:hypothetical protein
MAVQKVNEDFYLDMDSILGVRWVNETGIIFIKGSKIAVTDRDMFNKIKDAFIWGASTIYDGREKI